MTARLRTAAALCLVIAVAAAVLLLAAPAQAKDAPGPVCKWKDRKHPSCVVVLAPKWKAPDVVVNVTPAPGGTVKA